MYMNGIKRRGKITKVSQVSERGWETARKLRTGGCCCCSFLILGLEEIWRAVLKSSPGFPFLSPKGDCTQPRFIFIRSRILEFLFRLLFHAPGTILSFPRIFFLFSSLCFRFLHLREEVNVL